jgi:ABC-type transport system substrate-binding protein
MFTYAGSPDPDQWRLTLSSRYCKTIPPKPWNAGAGLRLCLHDKPIDKAFDRAEHSFNPVVRSQGYRLIQQRMNQRAYWVPLYFRPFGLAVTKRLAGYSVLWNPSSWRLTS